MKTHAVTFLPDRKTVQAAEGKSILEAAQAIGIPVNNVCAGDGVCGKCRVLIKSGDVTAKPTIFLNRAEIQQGMALACQTLIKGDVVVEVPLESRVGGVPQLTSEDAIRYGQVREWVGDGAPFAHHPLARKVCLALPAPTPEDNTADQERLYTVLRQHDQVERLQTGLSVLTGLPEVLRRGDWRVTALLAERGGTVEMVDIEAGDTSGCNYGVAVDVGTTTVAAHLVDLTSSATLGTKAKYNSQVRHGDDVIARIMYAATVERRLELRDLLVDDINDLITALVVEADVRLADVTFVLCAGNTTMVHLLLGLDPAQIRRDPYVPCATAPPVVRAAEVGITIAARGLLGTVPAVSSYVGGDVVADVLVAGMTATDDISLLIDLGTNGEIVLGSRDWLMCCSASAGPAFEGGGITCGMRATKGAIERLYLDDDGSVRKCGVVGGGKPMGICGSGLIDAVGELLRAGCIDRRGRFVENRCGSRLRENDDGDVEFVLLPGEETALGRDIILSAADVSNFIHSKGSVYMAAESLLDHVGLSFADLAAVYIAGGFGNYLRIERAIEIGLLPDIPTERFRFIGNGSVQGAKMALLSSEAYAYLHERVAGAMTYLELSNSEKYLNEYSSCLFLPHTDIEKFPSVQSRTTAGGVR